MAASVVITTPETATPNSTTPGDVTRGGAAHDPPTPGPRAGRPDRTRVAAPGRARASTDTASSARGRPHRTACRPPVAQPGHRRGGRSPPRTLAPATATSLAHAAGPRTDHASRSRIGHARRSYPAACTRDSARDPRPVDGLLLDGTPDVGAPGSFREHDGLPRVDRRRRGRSGRAGERGIGRSTPGADRSRRSAHGRGTASTPGSGRAHRPSRGRSAHPTGNRDGSRISRAVT